MLKNSKLTTKLNVSLFFFSFLTVNLIHDKAVAEEIITRDNSSSASIEAKKKQTKAEFKFSDDLYHYFKYGLLDNELINTEDFNRNLVVDSLELLDSKQNIRNATYFREDFKNLLQNFYLYGINEVTLESLNDIAMNWKLFSVYLKDNSKNLDELKNLRQFKNALLDYCFVNNKNLKQSYKDLLSAFMDPNAVNFYLDKFEIENGFMVPTSKTAYGLGNFKNLSYSLNFFKIKDGVLDKIIIDSLNDFNKVNNIKKYFSSKEKLEEALNDKFNKQLTDQDFIKKYQLKPEEKEKLDPQEITKNIINSAAAEDDKKEAWTIKTDEAYGINENSVESFKGIPDLQKDYWFFLKYQFSDNPDSVKLKKYTGYIVDHLKNILNERFVNESSFNRALKKAFKIEENNDEYLKNQEVLSKSFSDYNSLISVDKSVADTREYKQDDIPDKKFVDDFVDTFSKSESFKSLPLTGKEISSILRYAGAKLKLSWNKPKQYKSAEVYALENNISTLKNKIAPIKEQINQYNQNTEQLKKEIENLKNKIEELNNQKLETLRKSEPSDYLQQKQDILDELSGNKNTLESQLGTINKNKADQEIKLKDLNDNKTKLEFQLQENKKISDEKNIYYITENVSEPFEIYMTGSETGIKIEGANENKLKDIVKQIDIKLYGIRNEEKNIPLWTSTEHSDCLNGNIDGCIITDATFKKVDDKELQHLSFFSTKLTMNNTDNSELPEDLTIRFKNRYEYSVKLIEPVLFYQVPLRADFVSAGKNFLGFNTAFGFNLYRVSWYTDSSIFSELSFMIGTLLTSPVTYEVPKTTDSTTGSVTYDKKEIPMQFNLYIGSVIGPINVAFGRSILSDNYTFFIGKTLTDALIKYSTFKEDSTDKKSQ
jgi:hypothetical protein